jgi:hypothetical protein
LSVPEARDSYRLRFDLARLLSWLASTLAGFSFGATEDRARFLRLTRFTQRFQLRLRSYYARARSSRRV